MLLYQFRMGTNPRRVIIYLAEKGMDVPRYELDYANGEHRSPEYRKINPAGRAPTLVLESGLAITDSASIVEYLEERHPERPMIEATIGYQEFLAGDVPTIADFTSFAIFQTARERFDRPLGGNHVRLNAWYKRFRNRPSAEY